MLVELRHSNRKGKRYTAIFNDYKPVHFGAKNGSTFIDHQDERLKKNYIKRHKALDEDWNDPYTAGTLSRFILWEYPTIKQAAEEYNKRFFNYGSGIKTSDIHSVAFERDYWNTAAARKWLREHHLTPIKRADFWQKNYIRYRIIDPKKFKSFITKKLDNGINLIIGFYKS